MTSTTSGVAHATVPWQYSASFLTEILDTQNDLAAVELDRRIITQMVAERSQKLTGADGASVQLVDGEDLFTESATGLVEPFLGMRIPIAASLVGRAVQSCEVQYCPDSETNPWVDRSICRRVGMRSLVVVPLILGVQPLGVLTIVSRRTDAFEPGHISAMRLMVGLVAAALSHACEFEIKRQLLTERTTALAALRASEEEFRATFEMAGVGKVQTDLRSGRLLRVNEKFSQITGYSAEELAGMSFGQITHSEDISSNREIASKMLRGEIGDHTDENRYVRKDGAIIWVSLNVTVIKDAEGLPLKAVATIQDITDRKRAQWLEEDRRKVLEMVARDLPLAEVISEITGSVERQLSGTAAGILVLQDGDVCAHGPHLPDDWRESLRQRCLPLGVALAAGVQAATDHCGVSYIDTDDVWQDLRTMAAAHAFSACWTICVRAKDGAVAGLLTVFCRQRRSPTADEIRTLETAGTLATISIDHHNTLRQLAYLIRHDSLTGLPNRIMAEDRLGQAMALARRSNKMVAVMIFDVDRFKSINDTLGHHAGDSLLQQFSDRFNRRLRETDTMARIGGDEFVVMLPELTQREEAAAVAKKLLDTLADPFELGEHCIRVTCSIGIAIFPDDADDALSLQKRADAALYRAKEQGRDRYAF
jgi:diguanylate cyclase (GGDEF)-like protein/PAS domain S-box-containing protein